MYLMMLQVPGREENISYFSSIMPMQGTTSCFETICVEHDKFQGYLLIRSANRMIIRSRTVWDKREKIMMHGGKASVSN